MYIQIYENKEDLLQTIDQELDREFEMKRDYMNKSDLDQSLENIRSWFEDIELEELQELNLFISSMFGDEIIMTFNSDQEFEELEELPVIIYIFNKDGNQVDFFSGYQDYWSGTSQEDFIIYL